MEIIHYKVTRLDFLLIQDPYAMFECKGSTQPQPELHSTVRAVEGPEKVEAKFGDVY